MTKTLSTRTTKVRNLAGAALAALVTLLTLSLVAPSTAVAASGPSAGVNPPTAPAGESVTVTGSGFQPGETVQVQYGGSTIGSGFADANGDVLISGTIPAGMPEGGHPMDVVGSMGSIVTLSYNVAAPAPTGPSTPAPPSASPSTPTPSPSTPSPSTPKASTSLGLDGSTEDSSADRDGETELALGETAGTDGAVDSSVKVWGLVILVLAAAGLIICAFALRRAERDQI